MRRAAALDGFEDVDRVPDAFGVCAWGGSYLFSSVSTLHVEKERACPGQRTLLHQYHTSKAVIQVPQIDTAHTSLVVQLSVDVKRLIGFDLHLSHPLVGDGPFASTVVASRADAADAALVQRRVKLVAPWGAVAVAVTVVVAEEVVTAGLPTPLDGEGLVDGREEVFGQVRGEGDDCVEVLARVLWVQAAEEVTTWNIESVSFNSGQEGIRMKQKISTKI